jgi:hypothetical protein
MRDLKVVPNKKILRMNYTLINDGTKSFSANITYQALEVFTKMWVYFSVKIPKTVDDKNYQLELFKAVIDVEKALKGAQMNFLMSLILDVFKRYSVDELKFPMRKVSEFETRGELSSPSEVFECFIPKKPT